jgi:multimeric flavodoxin WrbA
MKITAFNGAMRGRKSITNLMTQAFLDGAAWAGAEVEQIFLREKKIGHCLGCLSCWIKTPGRCIQKDDMEELIRIYLASDVAVIATPVYVDNVTGLMKDFLDRLVPVTDPRFEPDENGESRHVKRYDRYPGIVALSSAGFPEQSAFQVLSLFFRRVTRNMNAELLAEIYRGGAGPLGLPDPGPGLGPLIEEYKKLLRAAGAEIAEKRGLSEETAAALDRQWLPTDLYNAQVNELWNRLISSAAG